MNKIIYTQKMNDTNNMVCISPNGKPNKNFHEIESFYARISPKSELIAYVDTKEQCIKVVSLKGKLIERIYLQKAESK